MAITECNNNYNTQMLSITDNRSIQKPSSIPIFKTKIHNNNIKYRIQNLNMARTEFIINNHNNTQITAITKNSLYSGTEAKAIPQQQSNSKAKKQIIPNNPFLTAVTTPPREIPQQWPP